MLVTDYVPSHGCRRHQAISLLLANDPWLLRLLFDDDPVRLSAPPDSILKETKGLSSGQQLLIRIALDIWSGDGHAKLWDIVSVLDGIRFEGFMLALECLRYGYLPRNSHK